MEVNRLPKGSNKPVILIGFAEAAAAVETAWSLQEAGYRVVAFHRSGRRPALRRARGVELREVTAPEVAAGETVADVAMLCKIVGPAAVLPLDDQSLWVCQQMGGIQVPVAGPSPAAAECALDKSIQIKAAEKAGLAVPRTWVLDQFSDGGQPEFPVMVKPARALYEISGKLARPAGVVCGNRAEFARAAAKPWPGEVLVQPLIRGVGEGIFGHAGENGVVGWSAHRRVRMTNPQGSGSSACESQPVDRDLMDPCEQFLDDIGWRGLFMLEFLRDAEGTPWFMELNGRTWGSMALARRRGFEYPAWTVRAELSPGFEPVPPVNPPSIRCRNLGLELVHLAFVVRGPRTDAKVDWPKIGQTVRDVCTFRKDDRLYNWKLSQPAVFAGDVVQTSLTYGRKMLARRS